MATTNTTATVNATVAMNKEEKAMTKTNGYMGTVIGMAIEDLNKLTVKELKVAAQMIEVKGYSKMKKAELIDVLSVYCDPSKKVEIIDTNNAEEVLDVLASAPVNVTPVEEKKEEVIEMKETKNVAPVTMDTVKELAKLAHAYDMFAHMIDGPQYRSVCESNDSIEAKWDAVCENHGIEKLWLNEEKWANARIEDAEKALAEKLGVVVKTEIENNKVSDMKQKYMDSKWDKLVKAVATEYVKQSLNVKWALFYKNTKSTTTNAQYLVKTSKLWGATSKVIKTLYGEKNCNTETIQKTLNAMVVRGYLNFQKVNGVKGVNIIFTASADQMNAMYKLSK